MHAHKKPFEAIFELTFELRAVQEGELNKSVLRIAVADDLANAVRVMMTHLIVLKGHEGRMMKAKKRLEKMPVLYQKFSDLMEFVRPVCTPHFHLEFPVKFNG